MALPMHFQVQIPWLDSTTGFTASCSVYFRRSAAGEPAEAELQTFIDGFDTATDNARQAATTESIDCQRCKVKIIGGVTELEVGSAGAGVRMGTVADDVLPEDDAVVIQRRSGLSGRSKRGRIFVPFIPKTFVEGSHLVPDGYEAFQSVATAFFSDRVIGAITYKPILLDRKNELLVDITAANVVLEICNRRDRYNPKKKATIAASLTV